MTNSDLLWFKACAALILSEVIDNAFVSGLWTVCAVIFIALFLISLFSDDSRKARRR